MSIKERVFLIMCCPCLCTFACLWGCTDALLIKCGCKKDIIEEHLKYPQKYGLPYPMIQPSQVDLNIDKLDTISEQPSKEMVELDRIIKEEKSEDEEKEESKEEVNI